MSKLKGESTAFHFSKLIHDKLFTKYSQEHNYNLVIINNILTNNKSLVVSQFKEFLLYEDQSEFLKRFYRLKEISPRLKKLYNYFHKYILIPPNYCLLYESKFMFTNIMRKQMIINKMHKHKNKQKLIDNNENDNDKINLFLEKQFFNNTLYDEILNQSESFMNILFGVDQKNLGDDNNIENENNKDMDEVYHIIKLIEIGEIKRTIKKKDMNKKANRRKLIMDDLTYNLNNNHSIKRINNINPTNCIISLDSNTFINSNSNMQNIFNRYKAQRKIKLLNQNNVNNDNANIYIKTKKYTEINTEISEKNINDGYSTKKIERVLYHRKMKSTLIGEYLNKLELPSNMNVINSLKRANEAYANNQNKNNIKLNLYKKVKFEPKKSEKNKEIMENSKYIFSKNFNSNNVTRENTNNSNTFGTPMKKGITSTYLATNCKKIEIDSGKIKNKLIIKNNGNSPIYKKNLISSMMSYNKSKKIISTNSKKNLFFTSLQNSDIKNKNKYNISNIKEVYLKPKALYKYKNNGISGKQLIPNGKV